MSQLVDVLFHNLDVGVSKRRAIFSRGYVWLLSRNSTLFQLLACGQVLECGQKRRRRREGGKTKRRVLTGQRNEHLGYELATNCRAGETLVGTTKVTITACHIKSRLS